MDAIRRLAKADLPSLRQFWIDSWGSDTLIMHGEVVQYDQVQGFIHRHALDESRKLKPSIPLIGKNNIPLRDEIELELLI